MDIRYRVELSEVERGELRAMRGGGKHAARKLKRAQILLAADAGVADETVAISLDVGVSTVSASRETIAASSSTSSPGSTESRIPSASSVPSARTPSTISVTMRARPARSPP